MPDTSTEYIELNAFLRVIMKVASTGGKAKLLIRFGKVSVNGEVELRNRRKLRLGDSVEFEGKKYMVEEGMLSAKGQPNP